MTMSVRVQPTPNPNAHKFVLPDERFVQSLSFSSEEAASSNQLASELYALNGVYNVFMAQDFVTINKLPDVDWEILDIAVIAVLTGHFD